MSTSKVEVGRNRIVDGKIGNPFSDRDNFAGDFVSDNSGVINFNATRPHMLNGQARSTGQIADHGLTRSGRRIGNVLKFKRLVFSVKDHGFHLLHPSQ